MANKGSTAQESLCRREIRQWVARPQKLMQDKSSSLKVVKVPQLGKCCQFKMQGLEWYAEQEVSPRVCMSPDVALRTDASAPPKGTLDAMGTQKVRLHVE